MREKLKNIFLGSLLSFPPLLWLYIHNTHEVRLNVLFYPIIAVFCAVTIVSIIFSRLFKDVIRVRVLTAIFGFLFFSYKSFVSYFESLQISHSLPVLPKTIIFMTCVLCLLMCIRYLKSKQLLIKTQGVLLVFGLVLFINPIIAIVRIELNRVPLSYPIFSNQKIELSAKTTSPDIYYIVIERYAGFNTLRTRYNLKDESLEKYLIKNNFYIADNTHPNYPHTGLSLASSLNMNYFSINRDISRQLTGDQTILFENMQKNIVFKSLKNMGYTLYNFGDVWQGTERSQTAHYNYNYYPLSAFTRLFIELTPLEVIYQKWYYITHNNTKPYKIDKRESELFKINKIKNIVNTSSKKVVFMHLLVTHEFYVLDKNGNPLSDLQFSQLSQEDKYKNHIQYGNKVLISLLKTIQKSKRPYVIVLQADEGPYTNGLRAQVDAGNFQWKHASEDAKKTHMSILNAYYFPDKNYTPLNSDTTPVNTFRIILNNYFGTKLPLLQNKIFLNTSFDELYDFSDVTKEIQ